MIFYKRKDDVMKMRGKVRAILEGFRGRWHRLKLEDCCWASRADNREKGLSTFLWSLLSLHAGVNNAFHLLSKNFLPDVASGLLSRMHLPSHQFYLLIKSQLYFFPKFVYTGCVVSIMQTDEICFCKESFVWKLTSVV